MIPKDHITAWRAHAPWLLDAQVEQDLVISRAVVELFRVPELATSLAFRGGTALYKLYLTPPLRYSEDIDLVQVMPGPIGETLDRARSVLDPWLVGRRRNNDTTGSADSSPTSARSKLEIPRVFRRLARALAGATRRSGLHRYLCDALLGHSSNQ